MSIHQLDDNPFLPPFTLACMHYDQLRQQYAHTLEIQACSLELTRLHRDYIRTGKQDTEGLYFRLLVAEALTVLVLEKEIL